MWNVQRQFYFITTNLVKLYKIAVLYLYKNMCTFVIISTAWVQLIVWRVTIITRVLAPSTFHQDPFIVYNWSQFKVWSEQPGGWRGEASQHRGELDVNTTGGGRGATISPSHHHTILPSHHLTISPSHRLTFSPIITIAWEVTTPSSEESTWSFPPNLDKGGLRKHFKTFPRKLWRIC